MRGSGVRIPLAAPSIPPPQHALTRPFGDADSSIELDSGARIATANPRQVALRHRHGFDQSAEHGDAFLGHLREPRHRFGDRWHSCRLRPAQNLRPPMDERGCRTCPAQGPGSRARASAPRVGSSCRWCSSRPNMQVPRDDALPVEGVRRRRISAPKEMETRRVQGDRERKPSSTAEYNPVL